jgi:hypothetical protein
MEFRDFYENCCSEKDIFLMAMNNIIVSCEHYMLKIWKALARALYDIKEYAICS